MTRMKIAMIYFLGGNETTQQTTLIHWDVSGLGNQKTHTHIRCDAFSLVLTEKKS